MTNQIASSLCGRFEVVSNGNHVFHTRKRGKSGRFAYSVFAGRTLAQALLALESRVSIGY